MSPISKHCKLFLRKCLKYQVLLVYPVAKFDKTGTEA